MVTSKPDLSVVVPVFNEEDTVPLFLETIRPILAALDMSYEIIFVDDGSQDRTSSLIAVQAAEDPDIRLVKLSRNFGKEAAMTAGFEWSSGAAVLTIDVDLQDPPELIPEFVRLWRSGFDVVYGQRKRRQSDSGAKRMTAAIFYSFFNALADTKIDANAGDFRLLSRKAVNATLQLRERNRFMKGVFAWVGFKSAAVAYERSQRVAGSTKFNYWRLWNFALDGITSFSTVPLKIWTYIGMMIAASSMLYMIVIVIRTLIFGSEVPGYSSLMAVILLLGAVQLISLGVIGEYLGRLYVESKNRPIYLVGEAVGFGASTLVESPERPEFQNVLLQVSNRASS